MGGWPAWANLAAELANAMSGGGLSAPAPDVLFWPHLLKVGAVLTGMVGVLLLGLQLLKRFKLAPGGSPPLIRVLATHHVAPKKALLLVAVGREKFLLANAQDRLTLLAVLPLQEGAPTRKVDRPEELPLKTWEERGEQK